MSCSAACKISRITAGLAAAFLVWALPSKAVTDILIGGAFLWALPRWRRAAALWSSPPGLAALLIPLSAALLLPFAVFPAAAGWELLSDWRLAAGAFALSVWVADGRRAERVLFASAGVLTLLFAGDLIRLSTALGPALLVQGRYYKPYVLNHPNVASLLAGATVLVGLYGAWTRRRRRIQATGFAAGAGIALAYLVALASRGPQAAFAGAAAAVLLLAPRSWRGRLIGLGLAVMVALPIGANLSRINARFLEKKDFLSGRDAVWSHTVRLIGDRPWLGYGYGKTTFQTVYRASDPPPSPFVFPHPHQYTLFVLFQGGRVWLILHGTLWLLLAARLMMAMKREQDEAARLRVALVSLLLLMWHLYGLVDCPDNRLQLGLVGLVPLALAVSQPRPAVKSSAP
ncbi:MAG: O-antigen ligase family protein [Kiritimatiellia bacterium]